MRDFGIEPKTPSVSCLYSNQLSQSRNGGKHSKSLASSQRHSIRILQGAMKDGGLDSRTDIARAENQPQE